MKGDPDHFESFVTRLGFQIVEDSPTRVSLVWRGGRFPGFICLGIAVAMLALSVPVGAAIWSQGWSGKAASLWYFPVMDLLLFGIAFFLLSLRRQIVADGQSGRIHLSKWSFWRRKELSVDFSEIQCLRVGVDLVYSGPAVAGSTAGQRYFPSLALRLVLQDARTVLLDRGSKSGILRLARRLEPLLQKPTVETEN